MSKSKCLRLKEEEKLAINRVLRYFADEHTFSGIRLSEAEMRWLLRVWAKWNPEEARVAQRIEQGNSKPLVAGSIPAASVKTG